MLGVTMPTNAEQASTNTGRCFVTDAAAANGGVATASYYKAASAPRRHRRGRMTRGGYHGVWWMIMALFCCCAMSGGGPNQLAFAQDSSSQCEQETDRLTNSTDYASIYTGIEPTCNPNGNDITCTVDYSSGASSLQSTCTSAGGKVYTTNEKLQCDYRINGQQGKVSVSYVNLGLCVGTDCTTSYLDSSLQKSASTADSMLKQATNGVTQNLASQGLTNCALTFSSSSTRVSVLTTGAAAMALSLLGQLVIMTMA